MKKLLKNNWTVSILINAIILLLCLLTTAMVYETNDDYAIAARIAAGYPYVGFVNYFLCRLLIAVQAVAGELNVYVLFLLAVSFVSFVCVLKTIFSANEENGRHSRVRHATGTTTAVKLVATVFVMVFAFDHYCTIQFTKTAALVMTAALIMMADNIVRKRTAPFYIFPMLLLYVGTSIRVDALPGAVGFAGIFALVWIIHNRKTLKEDGYFTGRRIILYAVMLVLIAGSYAFDMLSCRINVSTDELKYAEDYSDYRSNIVDYPTYEYYDDHVAEYDAIGISENDIYLIDHWFFDYDGAASYENLEKIDSIDRSDDSTVTVLIKSAKKCIKYIISSVMNLSFSGIHILMLCILAVWTLFVLRKRGILYTLGITAMTIALYLAIFYMQRPNYRALYVAELGAGLWLLYYLMNTVSERFAESESASHTDAKAGEAQPGVLEYAKASETLPEVSGTANGIIGKTGIIVAVALLAFWNPAHSVCEKSYATAEGKVMTVEMAEFFEENADNLYVWSTSEKKFARSYLTPWLVPGDSDKNVVGTGGWGVLSPYMLDKLNEYGISNPISGLIDNDKAYFIANKNTDRVIEYYNKWYSKDGKSLHLVKIGEISGNNVWSVK